MIPDLFDPSSSVAMYAPHCQADIQNDLKRYSSNLGKYPQVMDYLRSRGLKDHEIEQAQLGFIPPYDEHCFYLMKGRVVLPILDSHGRIVAIAGRQFDGMAEMTMRAIQQKFKGDPTQCANAIKKWNGKWVNSEGFQKKRHLFHLHEARESAIERGYVVLVEGYFDSLLLAARGIPNVATLGSTSISAIHIALIQRYCNRVVILLDGDKAGDDGSARALKKFEGTGIQTLLVSLPSSYDPDVYVCKFSPKQLRSIFEDSLAGGVPTFSINL